MCVCVCAVCADAHVCEGVCVIYVYACIHVDLYYHKQKEHLYMTFQGSQSHVGMHGGPVNDLCSNAKTTEWAH